MKYAYQIENIKRLNKCLETEIRLLIRENFFNKEYTPPVMK